MVAEFDSLVVVVVEWLTGADLRVSGGGIRASAVGLLCTDDSVGSVGRLHFRWPRWAAPAA